MLLFIGSTPLDLKSQLVKITGSVIDKYSNEAISYASIAAYRLPDSSVLRFQLADTNGIFILNGISQNVEIFLLVTSIGYSKYSHKVHVKTSNSKLDLGKIYLTPLPDSLASITFTASRSPVEFIDGVLTYNVDFFKVPDEAVLERLLKRLPGFDSDISGYLTLNGRRISRITIDDKIYFGDNIEMATKNLRADLIESVQIKIDSTELLNHLGIDDGTIGNVINIKLKKSAKNNWLGALNVGAGSNERYDFAAISSIFKDTIQFTALGTVNNVNKLNTTTSDFQNLSAFNKTDNSLLKISQADAPPQLLQLLSTFNETSGVSSSQVVGLNFNISPSKQTNIAIQNTFKRREVIYNSKGVTTQFLGDTVITSSSDYSKLSKAYTNTFSLVGEHVTKSLINARVNIDATFAKNDEPILSTTRTDNNKNGQLNISTTTGNSDISLNRFMGSFFVAKRFKNKSQRRLSFTNNNEVRNATQDKVSKNIMDIYFPSVSTNDNINVQYQKLPFFNTTNILSFAEPVFKNSLLTWSGIFAFTKDEQQFVTYKDLNRLEINQNSSDTTKRNISQVRNNLLLKYYKGKLVMDGGINWFFVKYHFLTQKNGKVKNDISFIFPSLSINWKQLSVSLSSDILLPSTTNLLPITDSSNPAYILKGNQNLRPSRVYSVNGNIYKFNPKVFFDYNLGLNVKWINDDIVQSKEINDQGIQTQMPVNANGTLMIFSTLKVGKEFKQSSIFSYIIKVSQGFSLSRKRLYVNSAQADQISTSFTPNLVVGLYSHGQYELNLNYQVNVNNFKYSNTNEGSSNYTDHTVRLELNVYKIKKVTLKSNFQFRTYQGGLSQDRLCYYLLNCSFDYSILNGRAKIGITGFDLLNQNTGYSRFFSGNAISEITSNVLRRFFLATAYYNFGRR